MKTNKPLTVLFDANPLVNGNKTGVGYYTFQLIKSLAEAYPQDIRLIGHYFNFLGRKDGVELPTAPNISYVQSRLIPGKIISITRRLGFQPPLELFFRRRGDVGLFTNFVCPPSLTGLPRAITVHDLCYIDTPDFVSQKNREFLKRFVPKALKSAKLVLTISEFTKSSIVKHYKTSPEKILVNPIPPIHHAASNKVSLKKFDITGKFMLFVGTIEPRKNILNLVKAYEQLPDKTKNEYALVLAGGTGWYMEETLKYIEQSRQRGNRIILTGYVSDDEKTTLYDAASFFVIASHYEGFGMPVLEAMAYGLPTIMSDIPAFREVTSDGGLYFDKDDPEHIAAAIQMLATDPKLRKALQIRGKEITGQYHWPVVAGSIYEALRRVAR